MKCSKLLLGLALACGITAANAAATVQGTSCELGGDTCSFQNDGSIVYFNLPYSESNNPQQISCELTTSQSNLQASAVVYPGKDASFDKTKITTDQSVDLSVNIKADSEGQIKFRLKADRAYEVGSVGAKCSAAATTQDAAA